jgi:antitoxin MazE
MNITTKVRRIGNSRGILFPKTVLDESGIKGTVQITVKDKVIMIRSAEEKKGKKWSDFKKAKKQKADFVVNKFDTEEWAW